MPGSVNGGFNSKKKSWQKAKRQKAREIKKRKGAAQKHKEAVKSVSGVRTKKHQRKVAHAARVTDKEQAALESAMQVDDGAPAPPSAAKPARKFKGGAKKLKKQARKAAAKPAAAAAAPEGDVMQD